MGPLRGHARELPSALQPGVLYPVMSDPERWARFLEWEVAACREPGTLDGGTHIIAVIQRATGPC
jgi:hypothetical protein